MTAKKWNEKESQAAVEIVLKVALEMLKKGISGDTYQYSDDLPAVSKERIISVFKWIISQAGGFKDPLLINFEFGKASTVGLCFFQFIGSSLNKKLQLYQKVGVPVPEFFYAWRGCAHAPYLLISDLHRTRGGLGDNLKGVNVINIHGEVRETEKIILLDSIPISS